MMRKLLFMFGAMLVAAGALLTTAHQDGTVQLWTYMSDNPGINQHSHSALLRVQSRKFGE